MSRRERFDSVNIYRWRSPQASFLLDRAFCERGGLFVTGTDTGVGKTWVACRLARRLRRLGRKLAVMKPAESGLGAGPSDAELLRRAAGTADPLDLTRPYAFRAPLAPALAAAQEGRRVNFAAILRSFRELAHGRDGVLVEGAGGLLVPLAGKKLVADLAMQLGLPLLVVARRGLGTINHCLLTLESARRRGLKVAAVVLNGRAVPGDPSIRGNPAAIALYGKVPVIVS